MYQQMIFVNLAVNDVDTSKKFFTELGYTIMAADNYSEAPDVVPAGFAVSLSGDDGDALRGYFEQLAAGGVTEMPLQKQVWGDEFGMCVDKFGISWLVNISQPQA